MTDKSFDDDESEKIQKSKRVKRLQKEKLKRHRLEVQENNFLRRKEKKKGDNWMN